jgi:hypothetical protein
LGEYLEVTIIDAGSFHWRLGTGIHFSHELLLSFPFCSHFIGDSIEPAISDIQILEGLTAVHNVVFWISTALLPIKPERPGMFLDADMSHSVSICVTRHSVLLSLLIDPGTGGCLQFSHVRGIVVIKC